MTRSVPVGLGERAYEVVVGSGLIDRAGERIRPFLKRARVAVVTDQNVSDHHGERLAVALEKAGIATDVLVIPPGEQTKSWEGLAELSDQLLTGAVGIDQAQPMVCFARSSPYWWAIRKSRDAVRSCRRIQSSRSSFAKS